MHILIIVLVSKLRDFKAKILMRELPTSCEKTKNTIKTKCSSVFFSLFVIAITWWLASLWF